MKQYFLSILFFLSAISLLASDIDTVRIGLTRVKNASQLEVKLLSGGEVFVDGKKQFSSVTPAVFIVKLSGKKTVVSGATGEFTGAEAVFLPRSVLLVNNIGLSLLRSYKGEVAVKSRGDTLFCVNKVKINDYLASVISSELSPKAPMEALKAQCVASRTFCLKNIKKHNAEGFDLCDSRTACCQVYNGEWSFGEAPFLAVKESEGLILAFNNEPIEALFGCCCGGETAAYESVFPTQPPLPYLKAVKDVDSTDKAWCSLDRRFSWKHSFKKEILEKAFKGQSKGEITAETDAGGNVLYLVKNGEKISVLFYRKALAKLGSAGIDSNYFKLSQSGDTYIAEGKGFGHRIGLCQAGALEMAKKGKTFKEILAHYYNAKLINERAAFARKFEEER